MSQAVKGDDEEVEVVELDDDSMREGDPKDHTRPSVLVCFLLAWAGTEVLKQGLSNSSFSVDIYIYLFNLV